MSANKLKPFSVVNCEHGFKWEVTKEEFEQCQFNERIKSPNYTIRINDKKCECRLEMYPKGDDDESENKVVVYLRLEKLGELSLKVGYQFGIETQDGYWPDDFIEKFSTRQYRKKKFIEADPSWGYNLCKTKDLEKRFVDNKITVVSSLAIVGEGENYSCHMDVSNNYMDDMRSMSLLSNLSDFTIVSGDRRFPCHRIILAARSEYFEALFRNDPTKTETEVDEPPELMEAILELIAKGCIPDDIDDKSMDLIAPADMYGLDLLTVACESSLVHNLTPENAVETLIIIDKLKHVSKLEHRRKVLDYIKKEVDQVVKMKDWEKFVQSYPAIFTEILLNFKSK